MTSESRATCVPTEEMADAVRGVIQILRGQPGVTFTQVYTHCVARGDDVSKWPKWALESEGYVTECAAVCLIYELMEAHRTQMHVTMPRALAERLMNYARTYNLIDVAAVEKLLEGK